MKVEKLAKMDASPFVEGGGYQAPSLALQDAIMGMSMLGG